MTRRKGEITWRMNERDQPHMVEMAVPPSGFGMALNAMHTWHHGRGITSKRGAGWRDGAGTDYVRWCFANHAMADAFAKQFGGRRLTAEPPGRKST